MKNTFLITLFESLLSKLSWCFVAFKFYYWFILSIWLDAPEITYINVIGVTLVLYAFLPKNFVINRTISQDEEMTFRLSLITYPWVILSVGYIFHSLFYLG